MKATKKQSQGQESPQLRVAAYLRVSTEEQAESGLGLDAQLERVNGMAMAKGWPQPAIYEDAGVSGMIEVDERKDGARLLADIASGQVNAVIVASLDRIGRRAIIILNFIATTKEATLVSAKESIDTSNAIGRLRDQGLSYRGIAAITHIPFTTIANIVNRKASYQGGQRGESDQTWPIILE